MFWPAVSVVSAPVGSVTMRSVPNVCWLTVTGPLITAFVATSVTV